MTAGTGTAVRQHLARPYARRLTLIPPLAAGDDDDGTPGFSVYGTAEVNERARKWALAHRYLLASGIDTCAHGLYMLSCPRSHCYGSFGFDHTQIWVPADVCQARPFILTQPYVSEVPARMRDYAMAHGLDLGTRWAAGGDDWEPFADNWYLPGHALAIRLTIPVSWPVWPVEEAAVLLLATQPVEWPGDDDAPA